MNELADSGADIGALKRGFSVVVCTYNRACFLEATLDSVLAQEYPRSDYELIIIDNNSTDGTRALVARHLNCAPVSVSYYVQREAGASFARNLGIERARYQYVAFLDDDTIASPNWLLGFDAAIQGHGAIAGGGPVEPVVEPGIKAPLWWREPNIRGIFGFEHTYVDSSKKVVAIGWPLWLGACNSFYSKRLLKEHGGFRIDCGPIGHRYRVAQDVELNVRLECAGVPIHYVRESRVRHRITADRLTRRYIWRRAYAAGITDAHAWTVLRRRSNAGALPELARAALQFLVSREPTRTSAGCRVAYSLGYKRKEWAMRNV